MWPVLFLIRDNVLISGLSVHKMMGDKERLGPKIDMSDDEDRLLITGWSLTLDNLVFHQLLRSHLCWLGLKWDHLFENPKSLVFHHKKHGKVPIFWNYQKRKKSICWQVENLNYGIATIFWCWAFLIRPTWWFLQSFLSAGTQKKCDDASHKEMRVIWKMRQDGTNKPSRYRANTYTRFNKSKDIGRLYLCPVIHWVGSSS